MSNIRITSLAETAQELCEHYPSLLVHGSVGRAAVMDVLLDDIKPSGVVRDIDIWRFGDHEDELSEYRNGYRIDTFMEGWFRTESNGTWIVFPYDESLAVDVPHADEVFAPQEVQYGNSTIKVPLAQTLGAIGTVQYIQRPKDKVAMEQYNAFLGSHDSLHVLSEELLRPFDEFRSELAKRWGYAILMPHSRRIYQAVLPEKIRNDDRVRNISKKIRKTLSQI